jgi:hypothetical protein
MYFSSCKHCHKRLTKPEKAAHMCPESLGELRPYTVMSLMQNFPRACLYLPGLAFSVVEFPWRLARAILVFLAVFFIFIPCLEISLQNFNPLDLSPRSIGNVVSSFWGLQRNFTSRAANITSPIRELGDNFWGVVAEFNSLDVADVFPLRQENDSL